MYSYNQFHSPFHLQYACKIIYVSFHNTFHIILKSINSLIDIWPLGLAFNSLSILNFHDIYHITYWLNNPFIYNPINQDGLNTDKQICHLGLPGNDDAILIYNIILDCPTIMVILIQPICHLELPKNDDSVHNIYYPRFLDNDGFTQYSNPMACQLYPTQSEQLIGYSISNSLYIIQ